MTSGLDKSVLDELKELEGSLWANDKLVIDTEVGVSSLPSIVPPLPLCFVSISIIDLLENS
jgi:hypothetical protein